MESELGVLRRELERLRSAKQATDHELLDARRSVRTFEQRLVKVKSTVSFQLGSALVQSNKSWRGVLRLPSRLFGVYRASRALRKRTAADKLGDANILRSNEAIAFITSALLLVEQEGGKAAAAWARANTSKASILAYTLIEVGRAVAQEHPALTAALADEALELYPIEQRAKALALLLGEYGHVTHAVGVIEKAASSGVDFNTDEAKAADYLRALDRLLAAPPVLSAKITKTTHPNTLVAGNKHVAIIGRETLPFSFSAAAFRLHGRAQAARDAGWQATVMTPPGYPSDIRARHRPLGADRRATFDGISYLRLERSDQPEEVLDLFLSSAAESFAISAMTLGARLIQTDTAGPYALAAAMAAASLGVPLAVDIDDLMDPHQAYTPGFERSEKNQTLLSLTLVAARAADVCRVHHPGMSHLLERAGVAPHRITTVPYRFPEPPPRAEVATMAHDIGLADGPVIGVVRDLCDSYDTLVLVDLLAELRAEIPKLKLLIVGQGRGGDGLKKHIAARGQTDAVVWIEKPNASRIQHYRALMDVSVFTRHDTPKAAFLSAYEVQGALASARAIVAYRTTDVSAIVEDGITGWLSKPGDLAELKFKVQTLLEQAETRHGMATAAREAYLKEMRAEPVDPLSDAQLAAPVTFTALSA